MCVQWMNSRNWENLTQSRYLTQSGYLWHQITPSKFLSERCLKYQDIGSDGKKLWQSSVCFHKWYNRLPLGSDICHLQINKKYRMLKGTILNPNAHSNQCRFLNLRYTHPWNAKAKLKSLRTACFGAVYYLFFTPPFSPQWVLSKVAYKITLPSFTVSSQ